MTSVNHQYRAFMAVVAAMTIVSVVPMIASWQLGLSLPDGLLAVADKSTTAFGTLLGTIGALMFRQSMTDQQSASNTGAAFAAIKAAQEAPSSLAGVQSVEVVNSANNPVQTEDAR